MLHVPDAGRLTSTAASRSFFLSHAWSIVCGEDRASCLRGRDLLHHPVSHRYPLSRSGALACCKRRRQRGRQPLQELHTVYGHRRLVRFADFGRGSDQDARPSPFRNVEASLTSDPKGSEDDRQRTLLGSQTDPERKWTRLEVRAVLNARGRGP